MNFKKKVYAIIPARGGSKGLSRKNILPLDRKPLIVHSIEQALCCPLVHSVYVTTDDDNIAKVSSENGATVIHRPPKLALDTSPSEPAVLHAIRSIHDSSMDDDCLILFMQCTSPLRPENCLTRAIEQFEREEADSMLSVSPSHAFIWKHSPNGPVSINYDYRNRPRRQDLQAEYRENGSFYIFKPWVIEKLGNRLGGVISMYIMDSPCVDIDTRSDFNQAELLLKAQTSNAQVTSS